MDECPNCGYTPERTTLRCQLLDHKWVRTYSTAAWRERKYCARSGCTADAPNEKHPRVRKAMEDAVSPPVDPEDDHPTT